MNNPPSHAVFWFVQELTYKIVAEDGMPSARYHLGKILFRSLKDAPDHILQIDGATDEKDTFKSALKRSVQCATAFKKLGLNYQDVIVIMAPNHINLVIPMYAALFLGIKVAGVDMTLGVNELRDTFKCCVPKIVFCQGSKAQTVQQALNLLNMSAQIIAFDENEDCLSFLKFLDVYGGDTTTEDFKPAEFDPEETHAFLVTTSGSTGFPKTAILNHKNIMMSFPFIMTAHTKFPTPVNLALVVSPIQWLSSTFVFIMGPILRFTRLQTSSPTTPEHVYYLINKYRPDFTNMSPTFLRTLLKPGYREKCDFSSLQYILVGGSVVAKELVEEVQKLNPNLHIGIVYGLTEATGTVLDSSYAPTGSVGMPMPHLQYKLVDPTTNEVINKPNVPGELRIIGPTVFQGYNNNPEMTKAAFDEDGWFKSGDILYRDEYHNYYFYDRIKMLLKFKNHQVSPVEIESVIVKHPGVLDVVVTGIADAECGDLPVALVILRDGHNVTAQEIKDLVKESLADSKQLRGGVIFIKEFPTTSTSKVDRMKLKEWAKTLKRE
ncbi:luciferin 4-monooxygenase-like [Maniola jurtina]|uniref:luciferin 4-monooxygenase-like n=1 Tax=Maniola jurtina TaxID=191418 RepID=UPI001E68A183|nr:luciferin 4-monooxygenase-like [Maniola jurtina]XP_045770759.1 luciferin 4-monooxygenase-like [Maniola jurtina]